MAKLTARVKRQIEYALFLAAGQDDPHSITITELCASLSRLTADNEALRKERDAARAAHHRTSHKAVKRLRALWREKQAAESRLTADNEAERAAMDVTQRRAISAEARADALAQEVERLREALKDIVLGGDPEPGDPMADQIQGAVLDIVRAALGDRP